jgi:hypothetical protein
VSIELTARSGKPVAGDLGSVSLELVGSLPVLILCFLVTLQFVLAGFSLWSAGIAARAGARAVLTGEPAGPAARRSLPGVLRDGSEVSRSNGVTVRVRMPAVLPAIPKAMISGRADLGER